MAALTAVLLIWLILPPPAKTPFHIPLILFSLMVGVGILVTADPDLTLPKATGLLLGLTSWYFLLSITNSFRRLHYSLLLFILVALSFTLIGALSTNWIFKVPLLDGVIQSLPKGRLILPDSPDTGVQANQLAGTIIIYWPLLLALLFIVPSMPKKRRIILATLAALVTIFLLLSQSRSGWVGALGAGLFLLSWWGWLYLPGQQRRLVSWGWAGLLVAAVVGYWLIGPEHLEQIWGDPVEKTVIGKFSSLGFRLEAWQWSVESIKDFPLTGTGLGAFRRVVKRLFPINISPTYDISHAHNIFLQVALDIGLPGLVAYLALLLVAVQMGWQVAQQDKTLRPFAIGLVTGLVGLHIYGLADALALGSKTGLLFWLSLGILSAMKNVKRG